MDILTKIAYDHKNHMTKINHLAFFMSLNFIYGCSLGGDPAVSPEKNGFSVSGSNDSVVNQEKLLLENGLYITSDEYFSGMHTLAICKNLIDSGYSDDFESRINGGKSVIKRDGMYLILSETGKKLLGFKVDSGSIRATLFPSKVDLSKQGMKDVYMLLP